MNESLLTPSNIAALIDHTLLKPEATQDDIARLCHEARQFSFAAVCVNPCWLAFAAHQLQDSAVKSCTVIGFPLGANHPATKLAEAKQSLADGAAELDMVLNIGELRSGFYQQVQDEIAVLADLAHTQNARLKVILETCLLTDDEKKRACELAARAHADFVKTSTGFSTSGATVDDVRLMRQTVGDALGVKASGGIRNLETLRQMVLAGANRIGTSSGVNILREINQPSSAPSREDTY